MEKLVEDISEICQEMRSLAEDIFGPARLDWTLGDIYFADGKPCIVYLPTEGVVEIQLSKRAQDDQLQLVYQLAHEVCHTLHPSMDGDSLVKAPTSVLNEGLSTWFSCFVCDRFGWGEVARDSTLKTSYGQPLQLIDQLLDSDPQAIRKLRSFQPWLDRLTASDFPRAGVLVSVELAHALCKPF